MSSRTRLSPQSPLSQSTNQNVGVPQFWALNNTDEKNVLYDRYWLLMFVNRGGLSIPASPPVPQGAALSTSQVLYSAFCSISFSPQGPFLYHKHYFAPPALPARLLARNAADTSSHSSGKTWRLSRPIPSRTL